MLSKNRMLEFLELKRGATYREIPFFLSFLWFIFTLLICNSTHNTDHRNECQKHMANTSVDVRTPSRWRLDSFALLSLNIFCICCSASVIFYLFWYFIHYFTKCLCLLKMPRVVDAFLFIHQLNNDN